MKVDIGPERQAHVIQQDRRAEKMWDAAVFVRCGDNKKGEKVELA